MENNFIIKCNEAIIDTDKKKAFQVFNEAFAKGFSPEEVVFKIIVGGASYPYDLKLCDVFKLMYGLKTDLTQVKL